MVYLLGFSKKGVFTGLSIIVIKPELKGGQILANIIKTWHNPIFGEHFGRPTDGSP
jgi:hypothetical protein